MPYPIVPDHKPRWRKRLIAAQIRLEEHARRCRDRRDAHWCNCPNYGVADVLEGREAREVAQDCIQLGDWPEWWGSVLAWCARCQTFHMRGGDVLDSNGNVLRNDPVDGEDESDRYRCWCGSGPDTYCKNDGSEPCPYNGGEHEDHDGPETGLYP